MLQVLVYVLNVNTTISVATYGQNHY